MARRRGVCGVTGPPSPSLRTAAGPSLLCSLACLLLCSSQHPEQFFQTGNRSCCPLPQTPDGSLLCPQSLAWASLAWLSLLISCISPVGHSRSHLGPPVPSAHHTSVCLWDLCLAVPFGCFFTWPVPFCHSYFRKCVFLAFVAQHMSPPQEDPPSPTLQALFLTSLCFTLLVGLLFTACLPPSGA